MLAYDYPLLGIFWSIFIFAMWALWIFVVIWVFIDDFRRTDHSGWAKALWAMFIIFVPIIGVLAYLVTRPVDPYVVVTDVQLRPVGLVSPGSDGPAAVLSAVALWALVKLSRVISRVPQVMPMWGRAFSSTSDALRDFADSLNKADITGWDVLGAVFVVAISIPVARLAAAAVRRALKRAGVASEEVARELGRVAKVFVYVVGFAAAASVLEVNAGFVSLLMVFALIIGALMLKPMVENSASGILLLTRPSFSVGDQIMTTVYRGTVEEIGNRATKLRQGHGVVVYVSNNQVLGNPFLGYSNSDSRKESVDISVRSDTDLDDITSVLMTAVSSVDDVVDKPAPSVQATRMVDKAITLTISQNSSGVTDAVIRATMSALRTAGLELTVPDVKVTETPSTSSAVPDTSAAVHTNKKTKTAADTGEDNTSDDDAGDSAPSDSTHENRDGSDAT